MCTASRLHSVECASNVPPRVVTFELPQAHTSCESYSCPPFLLPCAPCRLILATGGTDSRLHLHLRPPGGSFQPAAKLSGHENWVRSLQFCHVSRDMPSGGEAAVAAVPELLLASASQDRWVAWLGSWLQFSGWATCEPRNDVSRNFAPCYARTHNCWHVAAFPTDAGMAASGASPLTSSSQEELKEAQRQVQAVTMSWQQSCHMHPTQCWWQERAGGCWMVRSSAAWMPTSLEEQSCGADHLHILGDAASHEPAAL